jgi:hypothetical protein
MKATIRVNYGDTYIELETNIRSEADLFELIKSDVTRLMRL